MHPIVPPGRRRTNARRAWLLSPARRKTRHTVLNGRPTAGTNYEDAKKIRLAEQAMRPVRVTVQLEKKMGARLGAA
jgi:hypothetical protein